MAVKSLAKKAVKAVKKMVKNVAPKAAAKSPARKTSAKAAKPAAKKTAPKKAATKAPAKKPAAKKAMPKSTKKAMPKSAVKPAAKVAKKAPKAAAKAAAPRPSKASPKVLNVYNQIRKVMQAAGGASDPVTALRKSMDDYAKINDETMKLSGTETPVTVEGVPCAWYAAGKKTDTARRLMYLHGGGYMAGSLYSHSALCSRLAKATGGVVLAVDYRLIPENPFPAAIEDAVKVFKWMVRNGPDGPSKARTTFIAGDSAGGGLTLATLMALRDEGGPMPTGAIPISAWTDMTSSGGTMKSRQKIDPIAGDGEAIKALAGMYLAGAKAENTPLASPYHGNFKGLPPLLFQVGNAETLLDDSRRCHKKAKEAGVKSKLEVWPHMPHVWHLFAPYLPDATKAINNIGKFVASFK